MPPRLTALTALSSFGLFLSDFQNYNIPMDSCRYILHIDMDAFYASVEQHDNPSLRGKCVLVGALPEQRGVVAACSYEARKFGIHSAMPMSRALRLCPHAIVRPVRMSRYVEISRHIHRIFLQYTPEVEPISIDEAFLDVSGCLALFGNAEEIGRKIKAEIKMRTGLTASVGIAPNKFLAKLASDLQKPDGFVVITEETKQQILDPLPVSKIWGIGKVTSKALAVKGIKTVEQLRQSPRTVLSMILGNQADAILKLVQGIDHRNVEPDTDAKSISAEETFASDIQDKTILTGILHNQIEEVSYRLRAGKLQAKTIVLKFRYADFRTITRSRTLETPTNTTQTFFIEADQVFNAWYQKSSGPLRLLGFGTSGLSPETDGQKLLFPDTVEEKHKKLDSAFDKIREKYGYDILKRGHQKDID